ncbi:MAG: acyl transferase [Reichenbachiella sp.]|uniref:acyl transferase n=1 Tax=Reichenbachiella sp. TaxID=2184521 RepID=UPI003297750D
MKLLNSFKKKSTKVYKDTYNAFALDLFHYQACHCNVYRNYLAYLGRDHNEITSIYEIPYLPIDFFKTHLIKTEDWREEEVYMSSGTTSSIRSHHYIQDSSFYLSNAKSIFEGLRGKLTNHVFFALLPSYQEQGQSSLVKMVDFFISNSDQGNLGGFYLNKIEELVDDLKMALEHETKSIVLFGVGYALLDLIEIVQSKGARLDGLIVIETGGMKGKRKDLVKSEFYSKLKNGLGEIKVISEYGMTELLSQAYSFNEYSFQLPNQMKVLIRDAEDPFSYLTVGETGGVNVIDLANVHSCAFIETRDLGRLSSENEFEILGRLDNSDIRGCNLLVD